MYISSNPTGRIDVRKAAPKYGTKGSPCVSKGGDANLKPSSAEVICVESESTLLQKESVLMLML